MKKLLGKYKHILVLSLYIISGIVSILLQYWQEIPYLNALFYNELSFFLPYIQPLLAFYKEIVVLMVLSVIFIAARLTFSRAAFVMLALDYIGDVSNPKENKSKLCHQHSCVLKRMIFCRLNQ